MEKLVKQIPKIISEILPRNALPYFVSEI